MNWFKLYNRENINTYIKPRDGETKFGEKIASVNHLDELSNHQAKFVLFGIPEDIGVRANHGQPGTSKTWNAFLPKFLNIQFNAFNDPDNIILLGHIDCDDLMQQAENINPNAGDYYLRLGELVKVIDYRVKELTLLIRKTGKIPIAIGGGHNNAYGLIAGTSTAVEHPINILNIDAHTDLRDLEHRHSGNGFTYANDEGFINRYYIYGLHKNYTSNAIFKMMESNKHIDYFFFEDCLHLTSLDKLVKLKSGFDFLKNAFGLELDCDAIENFSSSAETPSGFSISDIRTFLKLARKEQLEYVHICEASANSTNNVAKAIAYLVSDFIRHPDD
ncbi:MAG: formimidoylglutamase [Bacteroidota bacterium]